MDKLILKGETCKKLVYDKNYVGRYKKISEHFVRWTSKQHFDSIQRLVIQDVRDGKLWGTDYTCFGDGYPAFTGGGLDLITTEKVEFKPVHPKKGIVSYEY